MNLSSLSAAPCFLLLLLLAPSPSSPMSPEVSASPPLRKSCTSLQSLAFPSPRAAPPHSCPAFLFPSRPPPTPLSALLDPWNTPVPDPTFLSTTAHRP
ncbi:hypothetical protein BO71DRAFT_144882 [Aspergillus ellipticus CBS 707.79]|uniref:Secreted protein n=1 Tax=Aspergillus ellipticus CBS 707.79 TaxID=1448320 RepID=A0A319DHX8_9EURO|nr:hypothetical protein BO71DRAFT_144882 [Aspergillus ellipticus CBS 707.79]